jgi:hypothetical protein
MTTRDVSLEGYWSRTELLGFVASWRESPALLVPLVAEVSRRARAVKKKGEVVRVGRALVTRMSTQVNVHVERGNRIGACVALTWRPTTPDVCSVYVGPLSRSQAKLQWVVLAIGMVSGVLLAKAIPGSGKDAPIFFFLGVLVGVGIGVGLRALVLRAGIGGDRPACLELSERIERSLDSLKPGVR